MKVLPCFTPKEMEEIGIGENGFYAYNPKFDPKVFFENYKLYGIVPDNYIEMLDTVIEEYKANPTELGKQKILEMGWNPELNLSSHKNPYTLKRLNSIIESKLLEEGLSYTNISIVDTEDITDEDITIALYKEGINIVKEFIYNVYFNIPENRLGSFDIYYNPNKITENGILIFGEAGIRDNSNDLDIINDMIEKSNIELTNNGFTTIHVTLVPHNITESIVYLGMESYMVSGYGHYTSEATHGNRIDDDLYTDDITKANVIVSTEDIESEDE